MRKPSTKGGSFMRIMKPQKIRNANSRSFAASHG